MEQHEATTAARDSGLMRIGNPPTATRSARELKVEDALLYLDQVKVESADRPHIYNAFLDILKNFKAQEINTPDVIEKVKHLFRGCNKLILGFNTFLSEGEGYKIELTPEEEEAGRDASLGVFSGEPGGVASDSSAPISSSGGDGSTAVITASLRGAGLGNGSNHGDGNTTNNNNNIGNGDAPHGGGDPAHSGSSRPPAASSLSTGRDTDSRSTSKQSTVPSITADIVRNTTAGDGDEQPSEGGSGGMAVGEISSSSSPRQPQQMQQAHAISYVTTIRNRFANEPETYRSFLKILHTYQKEQKGIKDVLEQVSTLFADHPDLLLEFTYFLPDAVQEQAKQRLNRAAREADIRHRLNGIPGTGLGPAGRSVAGVQFTVGPDGVMVPIPGLGQQRVDGMAPMYATAGVGVMAPGKQGAKRKAPSLPTGIMIYPNEVQGGPSSKSPKLHSQGDPGTQKKVPKKRAAAGNNVFPIAGPEAASNMASYQNFAMGNLNLAAISDPRMKQLVAQAIASGQFSAPHPNLPPELFEQFYRDKLPPAMLAAAARNMGAGAVVGGKLNTGPQVPGAKVNNSAGNLNARGSNNVPGNVPGFGPPGIGGAVPSNFTPAAWNTLMQQQQQQHQDISPRQQQQLASAMPTYPSGLGQRIKNILRSHKHHVTMSDERQFFSQVKDYLSATSRDAWNEFVKLLELFVGDSLTQDDLVSLSRVLFGQNAVGVELFEDFKALLSSRADCEPDPYELWYATPLSEIDFTQSKKCTPSYRALPKDFPKPVCSARTNKDAAVLNDKWASIPIGSEETFAFRHMRKNHYEEALFKCEDERFEIDMIIDSNVSTIRILEPLAEEIAKIQDMESEASKLGSLMGTHGQAPKFNFQLDRRNLTTIHLNSISRLYGDQGSMVLELLRKNPTDTVPVVLKRLKQKDAEWRAARFEMNKQWKETLVRNFDRSYDHRSLYFRQDEKRLLAVRNLVSEISTTSTSAAGIGATGGTSGVVSLPLSTVGAAGAGAANGTNGVRDHNSTAPNPTPWSMTADALSQVGLSRAVYPNHIHLLGGMTPQLLLRYDAQDFCLHRDIYRLICHAAESLLPAASDRERVASFWRDLWRTFFNIPAHFLYECEVQEAVSGAAFADPQPGASGILFPSSSDDTGTSLASSCVETGPIPPDVAFTTGSHTASAAVLVDPIQTWPVYTSVVTFYGPGRLIGFRATDGMYAVRLSFGVAFMLQSGILGADELPTPALHAIGITHDADTNEELIYNGAVLITHSLESNMNKGAPSTATINAASTSSSLGGAPLARIASRDSPSSSRHPSPGESAGNSTGLPCAPHVVCDPCKLFYGTQACYIFLRLHHIIYHRLGVAKALAREQEELARHAQAHPLSHIDETANDQEPSSTDTASANSTKEISSVADKIGAGITSARYRMFVGQLTALLDDSIDSVRYEDCCRLLLGSKSSYILFTLDKVITQAVRCLQAMVNDENVNKLVGLFVYHRSRKAIVVPPSEGSASAQVHSHPLSSVRDNAEGVVDPDLYLRHVCHTLSHTTEEVYRLQMLTDLDQNSSPYFELACQYLGMANTRPTASSGEMKAPSLSIQDEDEALEAEHEHSRVDAEDFAMAEDVNASVSLLEQQQQQQADEDNHEDEFHEALPVPSAAMESTYTSSTSYCPAYGHDILSEAVVEVGASLMDIDDGEFNGFDDKAVTVTAAVFIGDRDSSTVQTISPPT